MGNYRLHPKRDGQIAFLISVFWFSLSLRLSHLYDAPSYDEFYHLIAAKSWLADGSFSIYEGEYNRTPWYTILTAWMIENSGQYEITSARLPNVFLGVLLATLCALWSRQVAGRAAGWITAAFLVFWPSGIHLSQIIRFYALHGVLFFVGACAFYDLFTQRRSVWRRIAMLIVSILSLFLANKFQASTLVGILGLFLWATAFKILPAVLHSPQRTFWLLSMVAATVAVISVLAQSGAIESAWAKYNISPWGRDFTAYHRVMTAQYPLFWSTTPLLAILALCASPQPARFCLTLAVLGLTVHSFGGVQNIRYIYYLMPFLFVLWAIGIRELYFFLSPLRTKTVCALGSVARPYIASGTMVLAGIFSVFCNDAAVQSVKLALGKFAPPLHKAEAWSSAQSALSDMRDRGVVRVATNELAAIYYLDGFDVVFSKNWMPEMEVGEFSLDPRTGRPLIRDITSVGLLVRTFSEGVFLASESWWSSWPANNSVNSLMMQFNVSGVTWSMKREGPIWILHWTNEFPGMGQDLDKIRDIVDLER